MVSFPYYDRAASAISRDQFLTHIREIPAGEALLLHAACHNPSGADLDAETWAEISQILRERRILPFVDSAYHGFANGLEEDMAPVIAMAEAVPEMLLSYSCSKNFGLYRERTGALFCVSQTADITDAVLSHMTNVARTMYSMPPAHGAFLVAQILGSAELRSLWRNELSAMCEDVMGKRRALGAVARDHGLANRLQFITAQNGMFSLLPISPEQVEQLRTAHGVYLAPDGRHQSVRLDRPEYPEILCRPG